MHSIECMDTKNNVGNNNKQYLTLLSTKSTHLVYSSLLNVDFFHIYCSHLVIFNSNSSSHILSYSESWLGTNWNISRVLSNLPMKYV